jgi:hypothetical protein
MAYRTEKFYLAWFRRPHSFLGNRDPTTYTAEDLRTFLTHLAVIRRVRAATQQQAFNALLFLYRHVLSCFPPGFASRSGPNSVVPRQPGFYRLPRPVAQSVRRRAGVPIARSVVLQCSHAPSSLPEKLAGHGKAIWREQRRKSWQATLNVDVQGLDTAVRARARRRLPVVLTPQEVQQVLARLKGQHRLVCTSST